MHSNMEFRNLKPPIRTKPAAFATPPEKRRSVEIAFSHSIKRRA